MAIPNCFYRVSVKAVIRDPEGKILLAKEDDGRRDLPGGWLDHWETVEDTLSREIKEELGVEWHIIQHIPLGIRTVLRPAEGWETGNIYILIMAYEAEIASMDFILSAECEELRFFYKEEMQWLNLHANAKWLITIL